MKKHLILFTSLLIAGSFSANNYTASNNIVANAADIITHEDFNFEVNADNSLTLISYKGSAADIAIPEEVKGHKVTAIGDEVFYDNMTIKNVTLPDTIKYFGSEIFFNSSLVSVNIPENVQFIPDNTFCNCSGLEKVAFHDNIIAISNTAFQYTDIKIPNRLKECVTKSTVYGNSCNSVQYDDFICSISNGSCTLYDYVGIDSEIILPSDIKGIPVTDYSNYSNSILSLNKNITAIVLPDNLTEMNYDFSNLPNLKNITFLGKNMDFSNRTFFSDLPIEDITLPASKVFSSFKGNITLKSVNFVGDNELLIYQNIFSNCPFLQQITFADSYNHITLDRYSFRNTAVSSLEINSPSDIEVSAFENCTNLKKVKLKDSKISDNAFMDCKSLKNVELSGNTTLVPNSFLDCTSLANIDTDSPENLVGNSFDGCISLKTINNATPTEELIRSNFYMADDIGFINDYAENVYKKVVEENISDDMSDIEKVKILHDWVCNNTKYADDDKPPEYHTDASMLLNDSTVCEGYARACNLLFNYAGVETYYIHSFSHAWNIVKIGGQYFHIDSTWNDGDEISYEWFMKSDNEFKESHDEWIAYIPSSMHSFQKIGTPECKFSVGDTNTDGALNIADAVNMTKYILGAKPLQENEVVFYDMNFDNKVNVFDMIQIRNKLTENNSGR